jgi:riboflavin synthase
VFSGIVEAQGRVLSASTKQSLISIDVERPPFFDDLGIGDSICCNGVCLTIEEFDQQKMTFAIGAETAAITGWSQSSFSVPPLNRLNLERSLCVGDRVHGHMVSGHVDASGVVVRIQEIGGSVFLDIRAPESLHRYIWKKGSWAVNGVSLTINAVEDCVVSMCLIPETIRRTCLGSLQVGDSVNLEIDMMARGLVNFFESRPSSATKEFEP